MNQTTKLEAVNTMLSILGQTPIASLTGTLTPDAALAVQILNEVVRKVGAQQWMWNTFDDVELSPNGSDEIPVGADVARIDVTYENEPGKEIVLRNGKLYDKVAQSYTFTSPVKCQITYLFDFDDLPEAARQYCMIKAGRILQDRTQRSQEVNGFTQAEEFEALSTLKDAEGTDGDYTIFDGWAAGRVVARPYPRLY